MALNSVKVTTECGESWSSSVSSNEEAARAYFLGQWFNIGPRNGREDYMVKVVRVDFTPGAEK